MNFSDHSEAEKELGRVLSELFLNVHKEIVIKIGMKNKQKHQVFHFPQIKCPWLLEAQQ